MLCILQLCGRVGVPCEPDLRDRVSLDQVIHRAKQYVAETFPGLEPEPAIVESCMYTVCPRPRLHDLSRHEDPMAAPVGESPYLILQRK